MPSENDKKNLSKYKAVQLKKNLRDVFINAKKINVTFYKNR